ncbi:aspartic peptidase domain-containing protein [Gloeopeniophorella convolvens]|nr:aspartic peptidase domain-containing protein [Gloeopeniophorella convolvens]
MTLPQRSLLLFALLNVASNVAALHLSLRGEPAPSHIYKRDHLSGLDNGQNIKYFANITLAGELFSVSIDTGSSDLWVAGDVPGAKDTGASTSVQYAIGDVKGPVKTAPLNFLNFTVPDQAYIQVKPSSDYPAGQGLIGLGPNVGSNVHDTLKKQPSGDTVLDRIFRQNTSTPNYLTVLLSRSDDPAEQYPGDITVSEIIPGMENITSQPKLTVNTVPSSRSGGQHWQVLLDSNGIIGPDGHPITFDTKVSSTKNKTQLTAVMDTGFTLPQVPKNVSNAIYSRIDGAKFENLTLTGPIWTLPCTAEVNVTFKFGGVHLPVHPLDTNIDLGLTDESGSKGKKCAGAFQPITTGAAPDFDMILGMAFLRNVYLLINSGDFVDGTKTKAAPFAQLLSVTDPAAAHLDFVNVRLNGADTTGDQMFTAPAPDTPVPDDSDNKSFFSRHQTLIIILIAAVGGVVLLIFIVLAFLSWRRQRNRRLGPGPGSSTTDTGFTYGYSTYQPLEHGAPAGEMQQVQGYHPGAARAASIDSQPETLHAATGPEHLEDTYGGPPKYEYPNPWDRR